VIITHQHLREIGYCNRGARSFCQTHGYDWQTFLEHGVPLERLLQIDDDMVRRVIEHAEKTAKGLDDGQQ